jgi:glyoxylate/hydroxypyruvate reductase A
MSILIHHKPERADRWREALRRELPGVDIRVWPDTGDPEDVEVVVTSTQPPGPLTHFPNLRFVAATGAGIDGLLSAFAKASPGVPICRLVDEELTRGMAEYVLAAVLRYHRQFDVYAEQQAECRWNQLEWPMPDRCRVSFLGLGELGLASARLLAMFGFRVSGWTRSPRSVAGIDCFVGADGLLRMLAQTDILVCLLPLTRQTSGIVCARLLEKLPRGARFINVGRGGHVVEADLLRALETGHLAHATLDVFTEEPLPADHPFWVHPRITVTPHVASLTKPESAAAKIAANLKRSRAGEPLLNLVDLSRGY